MLAGRRCWRHRGKRLILVAGLMCASPHARGQDAAGASVSWDEIRAALEESICVEVGKSPMGGKVFYIQVGIEECSATLANPEAEAAIEAFQKRLDVVLPVTSMFGADSGVRSVSSAPFYRMPEGGGGGMGVAGLMLLEIDMGSGPLKATDANARAVESAYESSLFANPLALASFAPTLRERLAAAGAHCADCPTFEGAASGPMSMAAIESHVRALYSPIGVDDRGMPSFPGVVSADLVADFDPRAGLTAMLLRKDTPELEQIVTRLVGEASRDKEFRKQRKTMSDEEKLAYYQGHLAEQLPTSGFESLVRSRVPAAVRSAGYDCADCSP